MILAAIIYDTSRFNVKTLNLYTYQKNSARNKIADKHLVSLLCVGDLMKQAVSRSPATDGVSRSRLGHSMWVFGGLNGIWLGFSWGFSRFPLPKIYSPPM